MTYIGQACASLSGRNKSEHFTKAHYCKPFNSIKFIQIIWILYSYTVKELFGNKGIKISLEKDLKRNSLPAGKDLMEIKMEK